MRSGAVFSPCRTWRYQLWRVWHDLRPTLVVVGLNPSTADETTDDPTIRRCIGFARSWGYGSLVMANLFAFRATDPKVMKHAEDPVGPTNDLHLRSLARCYSGPLAAWGTHGGHLDRDREALPFLGEVRCLGTTKDGYPRHPLYVRADTKPQPYTVAALTRRAA